MAAKRKSAKKGTKKSSKKSPKKAPKAAKKKAAPKVAKKKAAPKTKRAAKKTARTARTAASKKTSAKKTAAAKAPRAKARPAPKARETKPARPAKAPASATKLGRFVWFDLMTADVPKALDFYGRVFGWTSKAMDMGGSMGTYHMLGAGGVDFGGIVPFVEGNPHWMPYVSVADIDAACKATTSQGGVVCVPPFQIPNVGRFAVVADPLGAVSSPLQMDNAPQNDPDAPIGIGLFVWNELVTPEPTHVSAFYGKLYGWKLGEMDMGPAGTYYLFKDGAKDVAGMTKPPANAPPDARPQWLGYVHVADVDATLAKATAAGARVGAPAFDVPGVGRMAIFSDPAGAMIAIFKPSM